MKKRLISLLVALCMAVTLLPVSALTAWAEGGGQLKIVDGYPVGSGGEGWSYDGTTLDLHPASSTEYDFLSIISGNGIVTKCKLTIGGNATIVRGNFDNTVINNGKISGGYFYSSSPLTNHGTIIDGVFVSAVSNESEGKIENGTFRSTVTNNGTIKGGIFSEQPAGGTVASGYTLNINFPENGSYEIIDAGISYFGNSGYVIPNSDHDTSITIYIFLKNSQAILFPIDVTFGDTHCLLEDWAPSARYYDDGRGYFSVTFTAPHADADTVTLSMLTRLVIDKAGYPVGTEGGTQDYSGDGWNFNASNNTLTLESGDYSFWEQSEVNCPVIIKDGVTTIGGMFSKKVTNYGTVEKAVINNIFENRNTVKNSYFFNSSSSIAVTNHGGTMLNCLFKNAPEGIESHTITEVEDYFISAELDGIAYQAVQTKFYFTGTPKLRVNLVKDGHVKPVTSINQKLNYGGLIEDYPVGYIFTVENDNEDVVLNQGTYPTLKMASNGTPIIDGAYYSTIESNIPTYFGDSWHCQKAMDSVGTLYLEKGTYDFRSTDPVNKNGEPLNAVICSIVNEGGTIEDGTFSKPIVNGQPGSTSSEPHVIEGGTFAAGLLYNDGVITGGAFNGKDSILPI